MKTNIKKLIASTIAMTMIASTSVSFATTNDINGKEDVNIIIETIEEELQKEGYTVGSALDKYIENLYEEQSMLSNDEDIVKVQALIDNATKLSMQYNSRSSSDSKAVAAVISYFGLNEYYLSAELLSHAESNKKLDSEYVPYYDYRVHDSKVIAEIRKGSKTSGSGNFSAGKTSLEMDLYYAIHLFNWTKSKGVITIRDRYDFKPGDYDGLAETAVNAMWWAQEHGVLTPFYTLIQTS